MNILTKNRLLEKGDEYRENGTWKRVPEKDYGLQIMFTEYAEVRRPSEEPTCTATPENGSSVEPESVTVATPTPIEESTESLASPEPPRENSHLPTVISPKAHQTSLNKDMEAGWAIPLHKRVAFTDLSSIPNWIGRNGTFKQRALHLYRTKNDLIRIIPEGMRGEAKNALMEIPVENLPEIVEWLQKQIKPRKET